MHWHPGMDYFESSTKSTLHFPHPCDDGHQKGCLGTFAVMDPKLTWIPCPPAIEHVKRRLATFGAIDLNLGLQPTPSLIETRIVSWNYLESWTRGCDATFTNF